MVILGRCSLLTRPKKRPHNFNHYAAYTHSKLKYGFYDTLFAPCFVKILSPAYARPCLPLRSLARSLKMSTGHFLYAPPCLA